jgi:hypothetical protein
MWPIAVAAFFTELQLCDRCNAGVVVRSTGCGNEMPKKMTFGSN